MFSHFRTVSLFLFLSFGLSSFVHAAIVTLGEGATNVNVGGILYDVSFVDGSCNGIFGSCNSDRFAFHTAADAALASQALLDQVFFSPLGIPSKLMVGCYHNYECYVVTPYAVIDGWLHGSTTGYNFAGVYNSNYRNTILLPHDFRTNDIDYGYGDVSEITFAKWTAVPVSEPSTFFLGLIGLATILLSRRRPASNN